MLQGPGVVKAVLADDEKGKPFCVHFSNGEVHNYSAEAAVKLRKARFLWMHGGCMSMHYYHTIRPHC